MDQIANVLIWVIIIQGIFLGFTYIFSKKSKSKAEMVKEAIEKAKKQGKGRK